MFPYGSRLAVAGFLNRAFENLYVLVIGRTFSPVEVGFYQRAQSFNRMGAQNLHHIVGRVTFPLYATIQEDPVRMKRAFSRTLFLLCLVCFPLMALMAGIAEPLVVTLIGEKWLPSAPYLALLAVVGALYPVHAANLSVLKALGHSKIFLRLSLIKKSLALIFLLGTMRFGITAIILGNIANSIVALWINGYYNRRLIRMSYFEQLITAAIPAALATIVYVPVMLLTFVSFPHPAMHLGVGVATGAFVLAGAAFLIRYRIRPEIELILDRLPVGRPVKKLLFA